VFRYLVGSARRIPSPENARSNAREFHDSLYTRRVRARDDAARRGYSIICRKVTLLFAHGDLPLFYSWVSSTSFSCKHTQEMLIIYLRR